MNNENKTVTIPEQEYASLKEENAHLAQQVQYLLEQVRIGRHRQFGASSEKSVYDLNQINLFNEAEVFVEPIAAEPELCEVEKHYRKKCRELPNRLPEELPVEVVEHVRYTYACRNCEKNDTSVPIVKAPMPESVIKGSFASPESIAHIDD